jgi:putative DNA primase/helicase
LKDVNNANSEYNIKEFATGGVTNRHHFEHPTYREELKGQQECYETLYLHTQDLVNYARAKALVSEGRKSVVGYQGFISADRLVIDIDNKDDLQAAKDETVNLVKRLVNECLISADHVEICFSGNKGFHITIPAQLFGNFEPSKELHSLHSNIVENLCAGYEQSIDYSIYNRVGLMRIENTIHGKTGLFAVPLTLEELTNNSIEQIKALATAQRTITTVDWTTINPSNALVDLKNKCLVELITKPNTTSGESESASYSKCDIKNWNKMFKHCPRLQEIERKSETGDNINHEERVFLGTIGTAFGDEGIGRVHELLKSQKNYNENLTDYATRSMINSGYKPTLCDTVCGNSNLCKAIKTINRRSPIAFAYTHDPSIDEPIDKYVESYVVEKITGYFDDLIYTSADETFYKYEQGLYRILKDDDVKMRVEQFLKYYIPKELINNGRLNNLVERIKIQPNLRYTGVMNAEMYKVNLRNGIFDLNTRTLSPHTKNLKSTIQLPFAYDPNATCSVFDNFLNDIFDGNKETIDYILKYICYLLLPTYAFQKVLVWIGSGRNGKGTLANIITNLLGPDNVSNQSIHDLADNQFSAIHLRGKLVNFSSELKTKDIELDMIKQLSGGDWISARELYKNAVKFQNIARLIIQANELPRFSEVGNAVTERFEFINFPKQFNGNNADTRLSDKLNLELSGIFNRVIGKMNDIIDSDGRIYFEAPADITTYKNTVLSQLNNVVEFVRECCVTDSKAETSLQSIFRGYTDWCGENNYRAVGKRTFRSTLEQTLHLKVENSSKHQNAVMVTGISFDSVHTRYL